jgi:hypothetical protein
MSEDIHSPIKFKLLQATSLSCILLMGCFNSHRGARMGSDRDWFLRHLLARRQRLLLARVSPLAPMGQRLSR